LRPKIGFGDKCKIKADFEFDTPEGGAPPFEHVMLTLSQRDGTMTIADGEKIYAYLTRDNNASLACKTETTDKK
jgi:hypothetical protein